jgi:hypothetical protein
MRQLKQSQSRGDADLHQELAACGHVDAQAGN